MDDARSERMYGRTFAGYAAAALLSLLALFLTMKLWHANLRVPFLYDTDAPLTLSWIKGIMDNGWYLHNAFLGAPFGLDTHDFPMADSLNFLIIKLLAFVFFDAALVHNLYYLLGFPLTTLTSLLVLRHFKVSYLPALVASLLFAFIPSHFIRMGHLFLASYYLIPPLVMVVLWIYLGRGPFLGKSDSGRRRLTVCDGKTLAGLLIAVLVSSAGIYYAFFACFFLAIAGLAALLNRRSLTSFCSAVAMISVISLGVLANLAPSILYTQRHGPNPEVAKRIPMESEIYALKISQMVLPNLGHRIGFLDGLRRAYESNGMPLINENGFAVLGLAGTIGFLLLLGRLLYWKKASDGPDLVHVLSILTVYALLLATIGGFSSLFGIFVSPQIRCWNRINLHIGFFSLFGLALLWDQWSRAWSGTTTRRLLYQTGLCAVLVLGVLDQTTRLFVPPYQRLKQEYRADQTFVREVERSVPRGAMIYQLPYFPYPEYGFRERLFDYGPLKGYLHSRELRWSHGAMKGREGDLVLRALAAHPTAEMLHGAALAGFSGIYLDRLGYADGGAAVEAELTQLLSSPPLVSPDQKHSFFSLVEYTQELRHAVAAPEWESARRRVLQPVTALFREGFWNGGGAPENPSHWCANAGRIYLHNSQPRARKVRITMTCRVIQPQAHLALKTDLLSKQYEFHDGKVDIAEVVTVACGSQLLELGCDARRLPPAPGDPRVLVCEIQNFQIQELD